MGGGTAHIEVIDRGAIVGPTGDGTEEEELFQGEFTLEDVALGEAEFAFEIKRRENLPADDNFFDVGGVLGDGVDYRVAEGFFVIVQVPCASLYGAYCTKQERTCLPGGATLGSVRLGMTISMYGLRE